jgi:hypothetical protein
MRGAAIAIGILAGVALWSPSQAADPKPDAALKNKSIEANVFLDDKVKADPPMAAYCLTDARARRATRRTGNNGVPRSCRAAADVLAYRHE